MQLPELSLPNPLNGSPRSKLLLVDDEPRNIKILQKLFQNDYDLVSCDNGRDTITLFLKEDPAVILLDIMMPGLNGYDVCRKIRQISPHKIEKIILISGKALTEEKIEGYEAGADDYLTKPFVHEEIQAKVKVLTRLYEAEKKLLAMKEQLEQEVDHKNLKLMDQEKYVYLGMHAAELVHNLKNPIAILNSYLSFIERGHSQPEFVPRMKDAVDRLLKIVTSILTSTKSSMEHNAQLLDLNQLIKDEINMISINPELNFNTTINLDLNPVAKVTGVPAHFSQILANLISNAMEAMGSHDRTLTIKTEQQGQTVIISVKDSGSGISPENVQRIFEPMFSTKKMNQDQGTHGGTGLGLAAAKKMVDCYGGNIWVAETSQNGTTMAFSIPCK